VFAPVGRGGRIVGRRGTHFRFTLSEPARVSIAIERALPGRRARGRCRKAGRGRRCTRWSRVGMLGAKAKAGARSLAFSGRFRRRALAPGTYRARIVAVDALGARSAERRLRFRVVRPSPRRNR
jgi:hypothetical protein